MAHSGWEEPSWSGLAAVEFGEERCASCHAFGPAARSYYLIHFVASGHGLLSAGNHIYPVGPGECFLIFPGEVTTYRADATQPWHYAWVGYRGSGADSVTRLCGFTAEKRVLRVPFPKEAWDALSQLRQDAASLRLWQLAAQGSLCRFLALLASQREENAPPEHARHYEKALWYMQGAYTRQVTVQEIADFVGLSRSQLFRVFERSCGKSPKQTLQDMRLEQARLLLRTTGLSVEQVALSSGLTSAAQLGVAFRERFGLSPRGYRLGCPKDAPEQLGRGCDSACSVPGKHAIILSDDNSTKGERTHE